MFTGQVWAHHMLANVILMEDGCPKTPCVDPMWRGAGDHNRPGTQGVKAV